MSSQTFIRQLIFNHVEEISKQIVKETTRGCLSSKGRDIALLGLDEIIKLYAMPWSFIKHYLCCSNTSAQLNLQQRMSAIAMYCRHRNATLDTFKQLVEWGWPAQSSIMDDLKTHMQHYLDMTASLAESGHCDIMEYAISRFNSFSGISLAPAKILAVEHGHLPMIKLLDTCSQESFGNFAMTRAATNGHYDIVLYLHQRGERCMPYAMESAASKGFLDIVKFLHYNRTEGTSEAAIDHASSFGSLETVQFLHYNRTEGCTGSAMHYAAIYGHLDVVSFLHLKRTEGCMDTTMDQTTDLEVMTFLHQHRNERISTKAMDLAAKKGCTTKALDSACKSKNLDLVKFLIFNRTEGCTTKGIDRLIANGGDLETIFYIHEKLGVEFKQSTLLEAIYSDRLDFIQYFHQHYPSSNIWTKDAFTFALMQGRSHIFKYKIFNKTTIIHSFSLIMSTTTTNIITFQSIIKNLYLKQRIFNHVGDINRYLNHPKNKSKKGKDIYELCNLEMISRYAMPWNFIKHYLPPRDTVLFDRMMDTVGQYCLHPNSNVETLQRILEWAHLDENLDNQGSLFTSLNIAKVKNREILEHLIENYSDEIDLETAVNTAALQGYLSIITNQFNLCQPNQTKLFRRTKEYASHGGCLDIVSFLNQNTTEKCSDYGLDMTVEHNHLNVLKYLHENEPLLECSELAKRIAIRKGHLEIIKFLHFNRTHERFPQDGMDHAASEGQLEVLKFLNENRSEGCTTKAMDRAAQNGHLEVVKYLHNSRTEGCTKAAMDNAKNLEILSFLHLNRTEGCSNNAINNASSNNNLEMIKFLFTNRTEGATALAQTNAVYYNCGLDVLIYLQKNLNYGCMANVLNSAKNLETIRFFHGHYSSDPNIWSTSVMDNAASLGLLDAVEFLHFNRSEGCSVNAMDRAASNGHFKIVEYLHKNRTEGCTTDAIDTSAGNGYFDIVKFLHFNRTEGCTQTAMSVAAVRGHIEIVEFLHQHRTEGCRPLALAVEKGKKKFFIPTLCSS
ncbi:hypothetical protein DFA_04114 [Cavenderia fasciculata]|uniref:Ankyrin repeat-containing protein n=1 Tax=Cavenderia fasciculata TaxID=261658 RepID=F4Q1B8_CACFS|nr:uncharacterized protein DFA_04114 [Cavenderia fasciculata]EGG18619.1 hypothetical protein DFA_04114 [Cavenderia fasciculata]|eukprot:XP_004366523.1 hypothetical protein DFA_04114 [Cavenderia fasciculata]